MNRDNPKAHAEIPAAAIKKPGGQPGEPPTANTQGPPNKPGQYDETDANAGAATHHDEHEGASDAEVGDTIGPGAGYDDEPAQVKDKGGVS